MENQEEFRYTYSAADQEEIKRIRKKYVAEEAREDKMMQLRKLDAGVTSKATMVSLIVGIVGILIMGTGMSILMTDIGKALGSQMSMIIGVLVGVIGMALACLAYPAYHRTLKAERDKVAPEILRLTDELMQ
jgi:ABC-type antimicrobial peptide transport system permease subunit